MHLSNTGTAAVDEIENDENSSISSTTLRKRNIKAAQKVTKRVLRKKSDDRVELDNSEKRMGRPTTELDEYIEESWRNIDLWQCSLDERS